MKVKRVFFKKIYIKPVFRKLLLFFFFETPKEIKRYASVLQNKCSKKKKKLLVSINQQIRLFFSTELWNMWSASTDYDGN